MAVLSQKLLSKDTTTVDKIKPSNCIIEDLGNGDTHYTVQQIKKIALASVSQTTQAAKDFVNLRNSGTKQLAYALGEWLYNNYQYLGDKIYEDLRWPSCAVATRHVGIDCKSFTITASSILLNLNVPHWIREIRQPGDGPEDFTHVYVIVKEGDKTYAIDGTINMREELPYIEPKDIYMSLEHRGLKAPQSISRAARMMRSGTTASVRTIGAKKLAKWKYKGLSSPVSMNLIQRFQELLAVLLSLGVSKDTLHEINETAKEMASRGRFPIVSVKGNTLFLDNLPFNAAPNPRGLRSGFDVSSLISGGVGAVTGGSSNGGSTGGFDLSGLLTGGSGGGFDLSNLLGGGGANSTGSAIGSVAGGAAGAIFGLPPSVGAGIGGALGGLFGGGSAFTKEKIESEIAVIQANVQKRLSNLTTSIQAGDLTKAALQWSKTLGFVEVLVRTYQQKLSEGWNVTSSANLQTLIDSVKIIQNSLNNAVKSDLQKVVNIKNTSNTLPMGGDEDIQDFSRNAYWIAYLGNDGDINVPLYSFTRRASVDPVAQMNGSPNAKTFGFSTTEIAVGSLFALSAIAGTIYYGKNNKKRPGVSKA
jgi:hypothetical protein